MNEWETEPKHERWTDPTTGYECAIVRHTTLLHLCGYVGVPVDHPWYRKGYDDVRMADNDWPEVHGGLTYASDHEPTAKGDNLWWLGFDCAHCGDLSPYMLKYGDRAGRDETYKNWSYVKTEVERLARQALQTADAFAVAP